MPHLTPALEVVRLDLVAAVHPGGGPGWHGVLGPFDGGRRAEGHSDHSHDLELDYHVRALIFYAIQATEKVSRLFLKNNVFKKSDDT